MTRGRPRAASASWFSEASLHKKPIGHGVVKKFVAPRCATEYARPIAKALHTASEVGKGCGLGVEKVSVLSHAPDNVDS